ncbi:DUF7333 family protein [Halorubrum distributum]|nr:hypothetical protein [Halorubrum arcis]
MEFDLPRAAAILVLIVAVGAGGLIGANMMPLQTALLKMRYGSGIIVFW